MAEMTPDEMRDCLAAAGWSEIDLAAVLRRDIAKVRRMASGREAVPAGLAAFLRVTRDEAPFIFGKKERGRVLARWLARLMEEVEVKDQLWRLEREPHTTS